MKDASGYIVKGYDKHSNALMTKIGSRSWNPGWLCCPERRPPLQGCSAASPSLVGRGCGGGEGNLHVSCPLISSQWLKGSIRASLPGEEGIRGQNMGQGAGGQMSTEVYVRQPTLTPSQLRSFKLPTTVAG
jgi:hypothetical protein